ncbi:PhzF family phenazine biosynthesis isomerase [Polymorphospora sp. NPDC050346]|uniref:PhzF family phenazine biosynthesis protein n=1 Tax=Polymorphospora sp. NPDC050346 TaxID=3155780 RepID=UPI0033D138EC
MEILRYAAFTSDPAGGNPAGVVLDASGVDDATMAAAAAEVGFSETAFLIPSADGVPSADGIPPADGIPADGIPPAVRELAVRYFSPLVEVPFCGHATIAAAVAYARRHGPGTLRLRTKSGPVEVTTTLTADGAVQATLTSVPPRTASISEPDLAETLSALGWSVDDLDPAMPPRAAFAGAWHPIIAVASRARLADLDYDGPALLEVMNRNDWVTVNLVWRESADVFHARNPFPTGGVVEDPATGAAAAALGGYLRELALVRPPARLTVHQGHDMGRPGTIVVGVSAEAGSGIAVSGTAVQLG